MGNVEYAAILVNDACFGSFSHTGRWWGQSSELTGAQNARKNRSEQNCQSHLSDEYPVFYYAHVRAPLK